MQTKTEIHKRMEEIRRIASEKHINLNYASTLQAEYDALKWVLGDDY